MIKVYVKIASFWEIIKQIGEKHLSLAVRSPQWILDVLLKRSLRLSVLEKGIVQTRKRLKIAKKACGLQKEPEAEQGPKRLQPWPSSQSFSSYSSQFQPFGAIQVFSEIFGSI